VPVAPPAPATKQAVPGLATPPAAKPAQATSGSVPKPIASSEALKIAPKPAVAPIASVASGGGLRVSLLPNQLEGSEAPDIRKRLLVLALVLVVETILLGVAYFFVLKYADQRTARKAVAEQRMTAAAAEIKTAEAALGAARSWNDQLAAAKETLDKHVRWTSLLAFLETRTLPSVKYHSFSGNIDGTVNLDAVGLSYRDVAQQIVALRADPLILEVRTSSAAARVSPTGEIEGVSFTLALKFRPEVLRPVPSAAKAPSN
jgi:Tfp pilus assembly protein PilN